jgi:molybdenum cofactor synthesis domain-containing protein
MEERGFVFHTENLLSPAEAVAMFFARAALVAPRVEFVALDDAYGRVLARRIDSDDEYPNAPRSAMDGFAVASADLPADLRVVGEIAMGKAWPNRLARGTALRIPTGGVVPDGADAVVPIEDAALAGEVVNIGASFEPGENVTPRGSDMRRGEPVLAVGRRIGGPESGVLATLGVTKVPVYRRPVVGIFSSGDELVDPERVPHPGEVRDSNRYAVAASLRSMGAEPRHFPTVTDRSGALEAALREALDDCDAVAITGGSSVGERDLTPGAIASLGSPGVLVHGLRVKPGKPTVLGAIGPKPVIGLPGNPTSALMILEAVAAPIVAALTGAISRVDTTEAVLAAPAKSRPGWTWFIPVALKQEAEGIVAHPLPLRSPMVSLTARADGYITMGEREDEWPTGTRVVVRRFL